MRLQVAVVRQGTSLIEKRSVITTKTLRFVILVDSPDQGIFVYPLTLRKLGLFLVEALKVRFVLSVASFFLVNARLALGIEQSHAAHFDAAVRHCRAESTDEPVLGRGSDRKPTVR